MGAVLHDWTSVCGRLGIDYQITVYDGGSTDATLDIIRTRMGDEPGRINLKVMPGVPHGPSILQGYREARSEWIFQMDSDDAFGTDAFEDLWARRGEYDILLACRTNRRSNWSRRVVTECGRVVIWSFFHSKVKDANTPYRLMRTSAVTSLLAILPDDAIVPNVLLSGLAGMARLRIYQTQVEDRGAPVGTARLASFKLVRAAVRSFVQVANVRWNVRRHRVAG